MTAAVFQRYDGETWVNVAAPPAEMDSPGSCAWAGGTVYCAFQGAGGNVTVATMVGKDWSRVTTIPGAVTPATPAVAVLDNQPVCVYQSNGSVHVSYRSTDGTWSPDAFIELDDGQYLDGIYGSPALVVFNDVLFCFYQVYNHKGNLRVATYDGTSWVQVGGKGVNLPKIVPGMAFSPTAAVFLGKIYVLYQEYGGDGDYGNGTLTGATFDGASTWTSLGDIATGLITASPAAVTGADSALKVFFHGPGDNAVLGGMSTADGTDWENIYDAQLSLVSETGPSVALVPVGTQQWLLVNALANVQWPSYVSSTQMQPGPAQALLNEFAPVVYLSSLEKYFPASVEWYLERTDLVMTHEVIISEPTAAQLPVQRDGDSLSCLIPNQAGTTFTTFIQNREFELKIREHSGAAYGMVPHPPSSPQAPFYGAVIDNLAKNATDLLYMFCYGYNGMVGNDFIGVGVHEGDWEHVIIRLDRTQTKIIGMFVQAHASDDPFSIWYYPQAVDPVHYFTCYGSSVTNPVIYSAAESHASYTTPGPHPIGKGNWKGEDQSDQGWLWNATANVVMVSLPEIPWLQFAGRWGATASITASSPDPPAAQGWFIPRSDGPAG